MGKKKKVEKDLVVVLTLTLRLRQKDKRWIAHVTDRLNEDVSIYSKPKKTVRKALDSLGEHIDQQGMQWERQT